MAVLTLALLEYGCSDDNDFVVVRGEVSYQGAPIEDGDIKFVHTPGTQTPARSAMIKQGKYEASGRGALGAGTYRIEIRAYTRGLRRRAADRSLYDANVNLNADTPKPEPREQVQRTATTGIPNWNYSAYLREVGPSQGIFSLNRRSRARLAPWRELTWVQQQL